MKTITKRKSKKAAVKSASPKSSKPIVSHPVEIFGTEYRIVSKPKIIGGYGGPAYLATDHQKRVIAISDSCPASIREEVIVTAVCCAWEWEIRFREGAWAKFQKLEDLRVAVLRERPFRQPKNYAVRA